MPKLKQVSVEELAAMVAAAEVVGVDAAHLHQRCTSGYAVPLPEPLQMASGLLAASRALADLAHYCLGRGAMEEMHRGMEARIRADIAKGTKG